MYFLKYEIRTMKIGHHLQIANIYPVDRNC